MEPVFLMYLTYYHVLGAQCRWPPKVCTVNFMLGCKLCSRFDSANCITGKDHSWIAWRFPKSMLLVISGLNRTLYELGAALPQAWSPDILCHNFRQIPDRFSSCYQYTVLNRSSSFSFAATKYFYHLLFTKIACSQKMNNIELWTMLTIEGKQKNWLQEANRIRIGGNNYLFLWQKYQNTKRIV